MAHSGTGYVLPQHRPGYVAAPVAPKTHMTSGEVAHRFETLGWKKGSGGDLYFDGNGGTAYPHLHMHIASGPNAQLPMLGRDVRIAVVMLAWSAGAGGRNFIRRNVDTHEPEVVNGWERILIQENMNQAMRNEANRIMDYFTAG